jgi:predicted  nucleic acid-binding Zn-ribbon protein
LRSIESDSRRGDIDAFERKVQEAHRDLEALRKSPPKITTGEELEALEGEIRRRTDELARLTLEHQLQQALDSEALKEARGD